MGTSQLKLLALVAGGVLLGMAALVPPLAKPDSPGEVGAVAASRLKSQARVRANALPAWTRVKEASALGPGPDDAEGIVEFVGPFGVSVALIEVRVGASEDYKVILPRLVLAWALFLLGEAAFVVLAVRAFVA